MDGGLERPGSTPTAARGVQHLGGSPQTLRLYEGRGLLTPARTDGGTRRYSDDDLGRLRRIKNLLDGGINLAGITQILNLEALNTQLKSDNSRLKSDSAQLGARPPGI